MLKWFLGLLAVWFMSGEYMNFSYYQLSRLLFSLLVCLGFPVEAPSFSTPKIQNSKLDLQASSLKNVHLTLFATNSALPAGTVSFSRLSKDYQKQFVFRITTIRILVAEYQLVTNWGLYVLRFILRK